MDIPFNQPYVSEAEQEAVATAVQQDTLHGDGPISERVQGFLESWLDVRCALLTTSCTHALEMAMITLDLEAGDEVIMPSFTFVSTANAVVLRGATPVFAEINPDTLNLDPKAVEQKITSRTKAIMPVHYGGVACDMEAFQELADAYDLALVEDAAQGVDAYHNGRPLGTIGDIGCYSFHDTKNITSGEGGAFLTNDEAIAERAEIVREKGTNRSAFYRGEVDKYSWVDEGSSYIQSDVLAALLSAQLDRRTEIKEKRKQVWTTYRKALRPLAEEGVIEFQTIPEYAEPNYHLFYFRTNTPEERTAVLQALKDAGIQATFHYVPLHSSPFGRNTLGCTEDLSITQHCSETLVRLPVYPQLAEQAREVASHAFRIIRDELKASPVQTEGSVI
jgi:dTDP-4-amino-4,6-dideoxygalactose transaminase